MSDSNTPRPRAAFPFWAILLLAVLVFLGAWYLAGQRGLFRRGQRDSGALPAEGLPADPRAQGKIVYSAAGCIACHLPNGQGIGGLYPPLAGSEWVAGSPARLGRIVLHGMDGPITVKGARYRTSMPGFSRLSDTKLAAVLTYIRSDWGNAAQSVAAEQVAAARKATAGRQSSFTEAELLSVPTQDTP